MGTPAGAEGCKDRYRDGNEEYDEDQDEELIELEMSSMDICMDVVFE